MFFKSPIHYMGNKYDLLPLILEQLMPKDYISTFYDLFGGSGTVSLNVEYNNIVYNDLDKNIVEILKLIKDEKPNNIIEHFKKRIIEFDLNTNNDEVKNDNDEKTIYYKNNYLKFRNYYNKEKNIKDLFLLSFYSFCNLIRFNSSGNFNAPFGKRCFTDNDIALIYNTHYILNNKNIVIENKSAFQILKQIKENQNQFIYLDPPYQNSKAIYNENNGDRQWSIQDDDKLFSELNRLSKLGIKWAYSNVLEIKGRNNNHIEEWANKNGYTIIEFEDKEYASLAKGNAKAREILILNYKPRIIKSSIYDFINDVKEEKMTKEFLSFFRTAGGGEGEKCYYPTRLDTYGCGCYHDCSYCYAKSLLSFRNLWNNENPSVADIHKIENKIKKLPENSVVRLGGMTDCFQPCELEHKVTYKTIELLNKYNIHYLIVTKSHIVANDEYVNIMRKDLAHIQITTTTLDDDLSLTYEKASVPSKRIESILKLQNLGFDVAIRLSPLMEEYMDIDKLNTLGINKAIVEFLRVNTWIKKWFNIDYSKFTLTEGGYNHLPLDEKKRILSRIKIPVISVCEDVQDHYWYWKENFNPNPNDCCNLRYIENKEFFDNRLKEITQKQKEKRDSEHKIQTIFDFL